MSDASCRAATWAEPKAERLQPWTAALFSTLLHLLMLLMLLYASKPIVTTSQSAAGGSRVKVDFIGEPRQSEQPTQAPQNPPPRRAPVPPAASRVQSTLVEHTDNPVPPDTPKLSDPVPRPSEPQPLPQDDSVQSQAQKPATSPPPSARRRPETWTGRPPGLLEEDAAPENAGWPTAPPSTTAAGVTSPPPGPAWSWAATWSITTCSAKPSCRPGPTRA